MPNVKDYVEGYARVVLTARDRYEPRGWYWAHELLTDTTWNNYKHYAFRLCRELGWLPYFWRIPTGAHGYWVFVRDETRLGEACAVWASPKEPANPKLLAELHGEERAS